MRVTLLLTWVLLAGALQAQHDPVFSSVAKARFDALMVESGEIHDAWMKQAEDERSPGGPDLTPLVPKFQEAAAAFADSEDAVPFLLWLIQSAYTDRDAANQAADTLTEKHAASPQMVTLGPMLGFLPRVIDRGSARELINAIREQNRDPDVLAWLELGDKRDVIEASAIDTPTFRRAKEALLARADAATDQRVQEQIRALIHSRENFSVGCVPPDIEGVDLEGVAFKLSDYKGKVIFLDFWGDW